MAKKRTQIPFYGKDTQFYEQQASMSMRSGNPELAKLQYGKAKETMLKRRKAHG